MNDVLRAVTVAMVWRAAWHAHIVEPSGHTTEVLNELSSLGYSWTIRPWHGWSPVVLPDTWGRVARES